MTAYYLILFLTPVLILYAYRALHIVTRDSRPAVKWVVRGLFLLLAFTVYASTSYFAMNRDTYRDNASIMNYTTVGAITLSVTVLSIGLFQLIADIVLLIRRLATRSKRKGMEGGGIKRRIFINRLALGVGGIMLGSFLWGTTKGRFGWRIMKNRLSFANLPKAFDGLKVVQISDLHLGSFKENYEPLKEAVQMINELEPDYIVFTGDLINEDPIEAEAWIDIFRGLNAKRDKFAVLGNHDYGWGRLTEEEKDKNSKGVLEMFGRMDLKAMANTHEILEINGERIGLVGVENWGWSKQNWFPTRGDYAKSVEGMEEVPFKILLSHDPTHWDRKIADIEDVDLTLAGHTHGGQMGIRIPGLLEISAGRLFYEHYAGLYTRGKQHLYVNRGMGYLIFPGRVGMPPEITLHELSSNQA